MDGYLLDTNITNYWHNTRLAEHASVMTHITALPAEAILTISVITLGEVDFGHRRTTTPDPIRQQAYREFLRTHFPLPLSITELTVEYYSEIRCRLFNAFPPQGRRHTRPEQCFDPVTATQLGIEENDLWIAAQAVERNLVLVTHDNMHRIRSVVADLLNIEDWVNPTTIIPPPARI